MPGFNEKEFEAENDLRTMIEAKKIDGSPKRKKAALAMAKKKKAELNKIKGV